MNFKDFLSKWLPVGLWCGVIFYLSAMPATKASDNPLLDYLLHDLAHVIEYGILFWLVIRARGGNLDKFPLSTFLFLFLYGLSDETHQYFVPTRSAKPEDIFFDLLGGLLAWRFLQLVHQRKLKK